MAASSRDAEALLWALTAQAAEADPMLTGRITICVRGERDLYWSAVLGGEARGEFVSGVPEDTSALLLMGEREASSLIRSGRIPRDAQLFEIGGDKDLLVRF